MALVKKNSFRFVIGNNFILKTQISLKAYGFLIFVIVGLIAYWQVAFVYNCLQWDMVDCYVPWRGFVTDCISNKTFPYWCPYQNFGYPIHADMRSVLSPEFWFSGIIFNGYSIATLHFFYVFYAIVSGYGMFRLTTFFGCNNKSSIAAGIVYMLSGYIVSQSQEISSLAGLAWIPFVILFYLRTNKSGSYIDVLKTSVFLFLSITGAYPALTIILIYLLLSICITYVIKSLYSKNYKELKRFILCNTMLVMLVLFLCSFYILCLIQSANYVSRYSGLNVDRTSIYPFTPQSLISLIFPFASVKSPDFFKTDLTMNNLYIGVLFFLVFILSVFRKRTLTEYVLLLFGFISLLTSFGNYTPVRNWSLALPLMSMFQYPAFFRPFVMIPMIIIAAQTISHFFNEPQAWNRKILLFLRTLAIIVAIIVVFSFFHLKSTSIPFINRIADSDIYGHIFLQGIIQLSIIISLILLFKFYNSFRHSDIILISIIALDMILSVQLNAYYTIVSPIDARALHTYINKQPHGFPIPELKPIKENTDGSLLYSPLWRNTNTISRRISFEGFNSFKINNYRCLANNYPGLFNRILENPPLYLSGEIYPSDSLMNTSLKYSSKALFIPVEDYRTYKSVLSSLNKGDSIYPVFFSPENIRAVVICKRSLLITYLQSNYCGWRYFLDGKEKRLIGSNINFISGLVPEGKHIVEFKYSNKLVLTGFIITYAVFISIIIFLVFHFLTAYLKKLKALYITGLAIIAGIFIVMLYLKRESIGDCASSEYYLLFNNISNFNKVYGSKNLTIALNCDRPDLCDSIKFKIPGSNLNYFRINNYSSLGCFAKYTDTLTRKFLLYFVNQISEFDGIEEIIYEKFPSRIYERKFKSGKLCIYSKERNEKNKPQFTFCQNFLHKIDHWDIAENSKFDTIQKFNGNKVILLDSISPYTTAFVCSTNELKAKREIKKIVLKADFKSSSITNESFIVLNYKKPFCEKRYWYFPLRNYVDNENKWTHAVFKLDLDINYSRRNIIEVFGWNPGGKKLLIGDIQIEFY